MAPEEHALLGASSAKQWLGCPPSIRLVESFGLPDEGSEFAEQGTAAHALAELKLQLATGAITKRQYSARLLKHKRGRYYDEEMDDATDAYVSAVLYLANELAEDGLEPTVELEQRVDFSEYVPHGFGTADCVIAADGRLVVADLKYGKGVEVSAEDNPQLKLYALGALERYSMLYDVETVRTAIIQPRLGNVSTDEYRVSDLVEWGRGYVAPRARMAWDGEGEYSPGEDTCRWCRAKSVCRARADLAISSAVEDFSTQVLPTADDLQEGLKDPHLMNEAEIAFLLPLCPVIESWCKDVREHALRSAQDGTEYAGWKLVEGRSNRKITDPEAAIDALEAAGVPAEEYLKPYELKGITDLTKVLGKKRFGEILEPFVTKPAGKPVLVPDTDRRPAIGSAESAVADFSQ